MATREEAEKLLSALRVELQGHDVDYQFCIPGWAPETSVMGFHWMRSQLWEGFKVAYKIDHQAKLVHFKFWEFDEPEPSW